MKLRNKKTGEIVEFGSMRQYWREEKDGGMAYLFQKQGDDDGIVYNSFAELVEEWEDYKPAEPLIKDEKVRKVVRAWAGCCYIPLLKHYFSNGFSCFICKDGEDNEYCLDFTFRINNLAPNHVYTIAELCGEEEE